MERLSCFYTADEARQWLNTSHALLNGERPITLVADGRVDEVLRVIEWLEAGAYI
jgi:uncharacterized protein (DUF2384 family)